MENERCKKTPARLSRSPRQRGWLVSVEANTMSCRDGYLCERQHAHISTCLHKSQWLNQRQGSGAVCRVLSEAGLQQVVGGGSMKGEKGDGQGSPKIWKSARSRGRPFRSSPGLQTLLQGPGRLMFAWAVGPQGLGGSGPSQRTQQGGRGRTNLTALQHNI